MRLRNAFMACLLFSLAFSSAACQKEEEKVVAVVIKEEKQLPPISQERIDVWVKVAGEIGEYIRKFSLEGEDVSEKRSLTMLSHSSQRTQVAFSKIFEKAHMGSDEFWNIKKEMERIKKYFDIKIEEKQQAKDLDVIIAAGREEIARLRREMGDNDSMDTIQAMQDKIREFEEFKGNISPVSVGVKKELISLWENNGDRINEAISDMWKVREREVVPYNN